MTPDADLRARALDSLLDWWALAGVEAEPAESPRPRAAAAGLQAPALARPAAAAPPAAAAAQSAETAAATAATLEELEAALRAFEGCALKRTAKSTVFSDGTPGAPVMIVGEAPGREEDDQGRPFVGRSGQLLDRMVAQIGLARARNLYIANVIAWRPPGNRDPSAAEIAACLPFIRRQIALAQPKVVVLTGRISAQSLLGVSDGITRLRGRWTQLAIGDGIPAIATLHPAFLLRQPAQKAAFWADLLALEEKLIELGVAL